MAAPQFVPLDPVDRPRSYESPDHVPDPWKPDRPAELRGRQPEGRQLGYQGPDQGYGFLLAERMAGQLQVQPGESRADAVRGSLGIALRRASIFGRAPVIHDLTIAFTIWGWLDANPPADLAEVRRPTFKGLANPSHHHSEARALVDRVPEATLRMTPQQVADAYPARWRELVGV